MSEDKWAFEISGKLEIPFRYFAGEFNSRFLTTLRDSKKLMGCRCHSCGKVFVPPRSSCEVCFSKIEKWVDVGPAGTVTSWTMVRYAELYLPEKPPYILALIKLDGADTSMAHIIKGIAPEKMKTGMRVEPVFAERRKASITDIAFFRPLAEPREKPAPKKAKLKPAKKKPKKAAAKKSVKKKTAKPKKKAAPKAVAKKKAPSKKKVAKKKAAKPKKKATRKPAPVKRKKSVVKKKTAKKKPIKKKTAKKAVKKKPAVKAARKKARKTAKAGRKKTTPAKKKTTVKKTPKKAAKRKAATKRRRRK